MVIVEMMKHLYDEPASLNRNQILVCSGWGQILVGSGWGYIHYAANDVQGWNAILHPCIYAHTIFGNFDINSSSYRTTLYLLRKSRK